jgi:sirohydrochlorin ferrochelatase
MRAVILFSHGSTLCGAGDALDAHAQRLRNRFPLVEVGYMNYSTPTFEEAVRKVLLASADEIVVAPFFLVPGYFVNKSLPDRVNAVKQQYPGVDFKIAEALGTDGLLADALVDAATHPLSQDEWRQGLHTASRACRNSPSCPLYGTADCPAAAASERVALVG